MKLMDYLAMFSQTMLREQVLRIIFKDSLKLFSGIKFCLSNGILNMRNGFLNLFSMKALCTYGQ